MLNRKYIYIFFLIAANLSIYIATNKELGLLSCGSPELANDSDYYDTFAKTGEGLAVNAWPVMLNYLNQVGIYNRSFLTILLYALYLLIALLLPCVVAPQNHKSKTYNPSSSYANLALISVVLLYPTMLCFATDVFRDIFMVAIFSFFIYFINCFYASSSYRCKILHFISLLILIIFLYKLRPYLGFAALSACFFRFRISGFRIYFIWLFYCTALISLYYLGFLDPILAYRGFYGFESGGSSFGLSLYDKSPLEFLQVYTLSAIYQLFGLYIYNFNSFFVFVFESTPFIFALLYVLKNRSNMDKFCIYLFYFTVIYSTIWIIGNDNLGTATRLRILSYLPIYMIAYRLHLKRASSTNKISVTY